MSASATQGGRNKFWQHQAVKFDFWATLCKTVRPILSDCCLSVCPVCYVGVLWSNGLDGSSHQDETWHVGRPRPWPHCARWGPSSPSPEKGAQPPPSNFRPISIVAKLLDALRYHFVRR